MNTLCNFAIEGWWITDLASFLTTSSNSIYNHKLEDSELHVAHHKARKP
jgi:hypothetical protein